MSHHRKHRMPLQLILITLALTAVVVLVAIAGTRAWLFHQREMATMTMIQFSELNLEGQNVGTLPIDLGEIDMKDAGFKRIPFRVRAKAGTNYILQIGHTTNLPLSYEIQLLDSWDGETEKVISGANLNLAEDNPTANDKYHGQTYITGENVQINAEPVYWQSGPCICDGSGIDNYVLIVSWSYDEGVVDKDTEMIYLTAGIGGYETNETTETTQATP